MISIEIEIGQNLMGAIIMVAIAYIFKVIMVSLARHSRDEYREVEEVEEWKREDWSP